MIYDIWKNKLEKQIRIIKEAIDKKDTSLPQKTFSHIAQWVNDCTCSNSINNLSSSDFKYYNSKSLSNFW